MEIRRYISSLVRTTDYLDQALSKLKDWKAKYLSNKDINTK